VNVLLSRAKHGMIMIGNMDTLLNASSAKGRDLWTKILDSYAKNGHIYEGFPVVCQLHPNEKQVLCSPQDFELKAKHEGCTLRCTASLSRGHQCPLFYHPEPDPSNRDCHTKIQQYYANNHLLEVECLDKNKPS